MHIEIAVFALSLYASMASGARLVGTTFLILVLAHPLSFASKLPPTVTPEGLIPKSTDVIEGKVVGFVRRGYEMTVDKWGREYEGDSGQGEKTTPETIVEVTEVLYRSGKAPRIERGDLIHVSLAVRGSDQSGSIGTTRILFLNYFFLESFGKRFVTYDDVSPSYLSFTRQETREAIKHLSTAQPSKTIEYD